MASSYDTFKDLNLTRDEVERITDALKDKKFRQLLADYVDEVRDPENQKLFQQEITQLEKERGVDVTFINPVAGYVIKTSANGTKKAFINICANEHVNKPASNPGVQEGARGLNWSLPHSLAPPREDFDKKGARCQVYDVVFHPDTLHLAQKNKAFRDMVNRTACEAVEANFEVSFDQKNLKFPKLQYKGMPQAAVIRRPSQEQPLELDADEKAVMDKVYAQLGADQPPKSPKKTRKPKKDDQKSAYTTPSYVIKHRRHVEMEEFTEHKNAKINTATPKELVVEVNLPLLKSSADIVLDVADKTLQLTSEKPAKYKLSLTLPYHVNQDSGNAKFDKDQKKLVVMLPVKVNTGIFLQDVGKDDSGVESDHGSLTSSSPIEEIDPIGSISSIREESSLSDKEYFLDSSLHYSFPEFTTHTLNNTVAFTLNVKNVDDASICKAVDETAVQLKFSSISAGFYPLHYAFYVQLPHCRIDVDKVSIEAWDNNVIVQISYNPCDKAASSYLYGLSEDNLMEKYFEEPSIINDVLQKTELLVQTINEEDKGAIRKSEKDMKKEKADSLSELETTETEDEGKSDSENVPSTKQSMAIDIVSGFSESSGDEISHSFSPTKSRGILKSYCRRFGRSISESGLDEVAWASSIENCHTSVDSVIPEEGEISTSLKKTVRFNDVVSRQLFRSNSSILGQRKKNQRKAKAKKRAQERRHSEGEVVETESKKERDIETGDEAENDEGNEKGNNEAGGIEQNNYFANNIFVLDMNY